MPQVAIRIIRHIQGHLGLFEFQSPGCRRGRCKSSSSCCIVAQCSQLSADRWRDWTLIANRGSVSSGTGELDSKTRDLSTTVCG